MFRRLESDTDPVHGIVAACQYLVHVAAVCRGFSPPTAINAGSASSKTIRDMGGQWFIDESGPFDGPATPAALGGAAGADKALFVMKKSVRLAENNGGSMAGACFTWANAQKTKLVLNTESVSTGPGASHLTVRTDEVKVTDSEGNPVFKPDNSGAAHIAFVLRVDEEVGKERIQFLDTGASDSINRGQGVTIRSGTNGNYEGPWTKKVKGSRDPFRGMGLLPSVTPEELTAQVERGAQGAASGPGPHRALQGGQEDQVAEVEERPPHRDDRQRRSHLHDEVETHVVRRRQHRAQFPHLPFHLGHARAAVGDPGVVVH